MISQVGLGHGASGVYARVFAAKQGEITALRFGNSTRTNAPATKPARNPLEETRSIQLTLPTTLFKWLDDCAKQTRQPLELVVGQIIAFAKGFGDVAARFNPLQFVSGKTYERLEFLTPWLPEGKINVASHPTQENLLSYP